MCKFRARGRRGQSTAWLFLGLLSVLLWASSPSAASAACIASPEPELRQIQILTAKNANQALQRIRAGLDAVSGAATAPRSPGRLAALYAVQAEAYEILERSAEARSSASEGLKLATSFADPVHVELLTAYAENVYDAAGIADALQNIETARLAQSSGSRVATCLLITRGILERRQNRADLAIVSLTQAYRATAAPSLTEPHVLSAVALSAVMRVMGDYKQALALNREAIDWDTSQGATLSLSVSRFLRGQILKMMQNYDGAIVEYTEARKLSVELDDSQGIAYADLRICEAHIELGDLAAARGECASAGRIFSAAQSPDSVKETQALQARIDLELGHPERALATLNEVLDHSGADLPPVDVAGLFQWRARANAALHNYKEAYADLREYTRGYMAADDAARQQQTGALRARFETDREIERNTLLQQALTISQDQAKRQARQLQWNAIVAATGVCVIALLIYFLITNIRYRKRLVTLAGQDGLTGLPNRRRTAEFAMAAVETALATRQPLSMALIDMDHFKIINDCCGHATGDHVLKEFALTSVEALRPGDLLGRWGGEEFLLVSPNSTVEVGMATLERLRTLMFRIHLPGSGAGLRVSLSAGLAAFDAKVKSLDELIARADGALYAAKSAGRDRVCIADASQITGPHGARRAQRR